MPNEDRDYQTAITYLYQQINYERTAEQRPYPFRLRRMRLLLDALDLGGMAGDEVPVVHIAGTKGKGSTASMIAAMLTAAGLRTGLYTSPHLQRLEERFTVDGEMPHPGEVVEIVAQVRGAAERLARGDGGGPTFFELTTAVALSRFRRASCDAVVLEVGLGGRLDSTNVCKPAVTAITSIGLDHQHLLGNTVGQIARQKAGIIKPGVPIISGLTAGEPADVIAACAAARNAPLYRRGHQFDAEVRPQASGWGAQFDLRSYHPQIRSRSAWPLPLEGSHQGRNAAIACAAVDLLQACGVATELSDQAAALATLRCAGRIERFSLPGHADLILDTAHNVDSIAALCDVIRQRAAGRQVTVIFGTSCDKDYQGMIAQLAAIDVRFIFTRYHGNPRYRAPTELLQALHRCRPCRQDEEIDEQPSAALRRAWEQAVPPENHLLVICGSFFLAAELRPQLLNAASSTAITMKA